MSSRGGQRPRDGGRPGHPRARGGGVPPRVRARRRLRAAPSARHRRGRGRRPGGVRAGARSLARDGHAGPPWRVAADDGAAERGPVDEAPEGDELAARLPAVLSVVYLIFNEGYAAHTGDTLVRDDLCAEAIRLGGMLAELMPDAPEVLGLLALMELQASRAAARADAGGNLVLLADQDRARWDGARIARGLAWLERAGAIERAGPYQLQAAIAACHARATSWNATEWPRIVSLYATLAGVAPSPVVELNRAAAIGMAEGPAAGLAALDRLDAGALRAYHLLPSARAEFLRRLGRRSEAAAEYRAALRLVDNTRERAFLAARLAECDIAD